MSATKDPFESYLQRAASLFEDGDIVQAGQIWQAILKKNPGHEEARAGLYKVKLYFDARATQDGLAGTKPAPAPVETPKSSPEVERLLEQGCTLYDADHVQDALARWEQVLKLEPENVLAKGYITRAKHSQISADEDVDTGVFSPPGTENVPAEPSAPAPQEAVDIEKLLRDGCTLFDMGQLEDALRKWEQVLDQDPEHALARSYVADARRELGLQPQEPLPIASESSVVPEPAISIAPAIPEGDREALDRIIREGVQLYDMGMTQEAVEKWNLVLSSVPDHADALGYLAMAERDQKAAAPAAARPMPPVPAPAPAPMVVPPPAPVMPAVDLEPEAEAESEPAAPAQPPAALTKAPASAPRKGLELPKGLQSLSMPAWLASPMVLLGIIVGGVVLIVGSIAFHQWRKEVQLRESIEATRNEALAPVARNTQVLSLAQSPADILKEGKQALDDEPLTAYYCAQELVRLNPTDAAGAQLLEKSKAALASLAGNTATLADYQKQIQEGDLDSAQKTIRILLAQNPDDVSLKERAGRLYLGLCQIYAAKERWQDASDTLRRGRAMFPSDKGWSARLKLLEKLQEMGRSERAPWVQLLG